MAGRRAVDQGYEGHTGNSWVRALLFGCGLIVLAAVVVRTGPALLAEMLGRVGWHVASVIALYAAHVGLRACALWRVVVGAPVRFAHVLRARLAAEAVEVLTFTGPFLAEPAKGWLLIQSGLPAAEAFAAVATEYLLYTTVSAVLALIAFILLIADGIAPASARFAAMATAAAMAAFVGAVAFAAFSGIGLIVPIVRTLGAVIGRSRAARAAGTIAPVERVVVAFLHQRPRRLAEVIGIEIAGHSLLIAEIWIVLSAVGAAFSLRDPIIIEGGAKLTAVAFFFIPGQLGAAEAVYTSLFRAVGLSAAAGLTLAVVRRVRNLTVTGVGLLVATWFGRPLRLSAEAPRGGAPMAFRLTSSAFRDGHAIPTEFTCDGDGVSPPLLWSGAPEATRSFALIMDDPDAPGGTFTHWLLYDVPATHVTLDRGVATGDFAHTLKNDFGKPGYGGPCPPRGRGVHRYRFTLHALDVPSLRFHGHRREDLDRALGEHSLAAAALTGRYERT